MKVVVVRPTRCGWRRFAQAMPPALTTKKTQPASSIFQLPLTVAQIKVVTVSTEPKLSPKP